MKGHCFLPSLLVALLATAWLGGGAAAQDRPRLSIAEQLGLQNLGGAGGGATFTGSFSIQEGSRRGVVSLTASMDEGWHVYSVTQQKGATTPSEIKIADERIQVLGPFQPDQPPHVKQLEIFNVPVEEHTGKVVWSAPIELAEGVDPQSLAIELRYSGQVCNDDVGLCIPLDEKVQAKFAGYTKAPATPGEYRPDPARAQVVFKGRVEPAAVAPGGKAKLTITAEPNEGWHIYAYSATDPNTVGANKPTLIVLQLPPGWKQSPVAASAKPIVKPAEGTLPEARYHKDPVSWTIELTVPPTTEAGEHILTGYVGFQTCTDRSCGPPEAVQLRIPVTVGSSSRSGTFPVEFVELSRSSNAPGAVTGYTAVAKLAKENPAPTGGVDFAALAPIIGFGLLGGLILNLMPCVLPVIGLKIMSFMQQGGESRARVFALNLWFAAGLLFVFLILATLAAFGSLLVGENLGWGEQFTYTWFKVAMIVLVFAFALSFLGVWEVPIPGFAQSSASDKLQQQEGIAGAFFKGVFTTLLATPCSGPFLGPVFGFTLAQPPLVIYAIFASVGVGMASPYLLIGAFPALVKWLPRPGPWMDTFKQVMGFLLLGTVVYLFSTIAADYFIATLTLVVGVWFACWLIGRVPVFEEGRKQAVAWGWGIASAAAIGWFAFTYLGPAKEILPWQPYTPETLARLQEEGKTVMIDFTADWCPTCKVNLKFAINTSRVKEVVEQNDVVPLLADWTDRGPVIKAKLNELDSNSIPVLAIYPANRPGEVIVLRDLLLEGQVIEALEQAGPSQGVAIESGSAAAAETAMAPPAG